jgi:hypothetical protein
MLRKISSRIANPSPDWRLPERFYEQRSEIGADLRALARRLEQNGTQTMSNGWPAGNSQPLPGITPKPDIAMPPAEVPVPNPRSRPPIQPTSQPDGRVTKHDVAIDYSA